MFLLSSQSLLKERTQPVYPQCSPPRCIYKIIQKSIQHVVFLQVHRWPLLH